MIQLKPQRPDLHLRQPLPGLVPLPEVHSSQQRATVDDGIYTLQGLATFTILQCLVKQRLPHLSVGLQGQQEAAWSAHRLKHQVWTRQAAACSGTCSERSSVTINMHKHPTACGTQEHLSS